MKKLYDYFYIGLLVVSISGATTFARGIVDYENVSLYVYLFFSVFTLVLHINEVSRKNISHLFSFILYIILFSFYIKISFDDKMIGFIFPLIISVFHAFVLVVVYRQKFIFYFHNIIVFMSIVAVLFWIGNLLITAPVESFVKTFQFSEQYGKSFGEESNVAANVIFYTLANYSSITQDDGEFSVVLRNSGFAWEPGAFASILIIAIFCNAIIYKFSINKKLILLIIALLSSQSTTGLLLLCLFMVFYSYNKSKTKFFVLMAFFSLVISLILTSSLVLNKFDAEFEYTNIQHLNKDDRYSPRRFLSLQIDLLDFVHQPLGSGLGKYTWHYSFAENIHTVSGLGKLFSYYGIFSVVLFFYFLLKSGRYFAAIFQFRGYFIFVIMLIGILFSYEFTFRPIFAYFWMFSIFAINKFDNYSSFPKRL